LFKIRKPGLFHGGKVILVREGSGKVADTFLVVERTSIQFKAGEVDPMIMEGLVKEGECGNVN
jgi:hypothetical protein